MPVSNSTKIINTTTDSGTQVEQKPSFFANAYRVIEKWPSKGANFVKQHAKPIGYTTAAVTVLGILGGIIKYFYNADKNNFSNGTEPAWYENGYVQMCGALLVGVGSIVSYLKCKSSDVRNLGPVNLDSNNANNIFDPNHVSKPTVNIFDPNHVSKPTVNIFTPAQESEPQTYVVMPTAPKTKNKPVLPYLTHQALDD